MGIRLVEIDVSLMLESAVYVLRWRGRVVYVGQARVPLVRVYTHRNLRQRQIKGHTTKIRSKLRPIIFDRVALVPTKVADLDRVERELIAKYQPEYNIQHKGLLQVSIEDLIGYSLAKPKVEIGKRL